MLRIGSLAQESTCLGVAKKKKKNQFSGWPRLELILKPTVLEISWVRWEQGGGVSPGSLQHP